MKKYSGKVETKIDEQEKNTLSSLLIVLTMNDCSMCLKWIIFVYRFITFHQSKIKICFLS